MDEEIQVSEVSYGRTINVGNFENVRIDYRAKVKPGQTHDQVMAALKRICRDEENRVLRQYNLTARIT